MAKRFEVGVRISGDSRGAVAAAKKTESAFTRMGSVIKKNALAIASAMGTLLVAFRQMDKEARLQGQTEALKRNLGQQGIALKSFVAEVKAAADAQLSSAQVISAAGKAMVLGIPAEKMAELMEVAKASAIALGTEVGTAFEDLTLGLARRSLPILDNLGFTTTDLTKAKEDFAKAAGKTVEALSGEETAAALLNGVLTIGKTRVEEYGDAQSEAARRINQAKAAMADVSRVLGQTLNAATLAAAAGAIGLAKAYNLAAVAVAKFRIAVYSALPGTEQLVADMELMRAEAGEAAAKLDVLGKQLQAGARTMAALAAGTDEAAAGTENLGRKLDILGGKSDELEGHFENATDAAVGLGNALGVVTSIELELEIDKITEALAESTAKMDENGAEYHRLEEIAREKIESIRVRIEGLRDGLGDLKVSTEEGADAWVDYGSSVGVARAEAGQLLTQLRTLRVEVETPLRGDFRMAQARRSRGGSGVTPRGRHTGFNIPGGTFTYVTTIPSVRTQPNGRLVVG